METALVPFPVFFEETRRLGFQLREAEASFAYNMALEAARLGEGYTHPVESAGSSPVRCALDCNLYSGNGITGFEPRLYVIPNYETSIIGKIDTGNLEDQLRACSWTLQQQLDKYLPGIFGILLQLRNTGPRGKSIAESLMLKYWEGSAVEKYIDLSELKLKYRRKEYFAVKGNHLDFMIQEAEALLSGRPVFKDFGQIKFDPLNGSWTQLSFHLQQGSLQKERHTYPGYDITSQVLELPFMEKPSERDVTGIVGLLLVGNTVPIELEVNGQGQLAMLSADPKRQGITLCDGSGKEYNAATLIAARLQRVQEQLKEKNGQSNNANKRKGLGR